MRPHQHTGSLGYVVYRLFAKREKRRSEPKPPPLLFIVSAYLPRPLLISTAIAIVQDMTDTNWNSNVQYRMGLWKREWPGVRVKESLQRGEERENIYIDPPPPSFHPAHPLIILFPLFVFVGGYDSLHMSTISKYCESKALKQSPCRAVEATRTMIITTIGRSNPPDSLATETVCLRTLMGHSRGGALVPSSYADARYIDGLVVSKALPLWGACLHALPSTPMARLTSQRLRPCSSSVPH